MNRSIFSFATAAIVVYLLVAGVIPAPAAGAASVPGVVVNGQPVVFDQPPIEKQGRVYVPLRGVFERLGASVLWTRPNIITAQRATTSVRLLIGSTTAYVNGAAQSLDAPPFLVGGRTLVPLRFISQSLGASVNWVAKSNMVYIALAIAGAPPAGAPPAGPPLPPSVVTASLSASPAVYPGPCPTDIIFKGSISQSAAGTLSYRFMRSDGSISPATGKFSYTFPAGGALNVADVLVQLSTSGNDKLEVYNSSGTLLQSATAPFSVDCKLAGGGAGAGVTSASRVKTTSTREHLQDLLALGLAPPTNLHSTNDRDVCVQHFLPAVTTADAARAACDSIMQSMQAGKLVLVWDWASSCPSGHTCPPADGYRVYPSVTSGTPAAIATTHGGGATVTVIDPKASPTGCYAVTAYNGSAESDESSAFCLKGFLQLPP